MANNDGYYSFEPRPGLRFVVLDTVTDECGAPICSEGSVDDTQFRWLRGEIEAAEAAGQYVMVFSHHTLRTTRFASTDPFEDPLHFGERVDRRGGQPQPPSPGQTLEELFCEHPAVIAHIAGHEHENYVEGHECAEDQPPTAGPGQFWHVSTSAHIDWPQQSRMVELIDNGDGTMSLALTIIDHAGPPDPGGPPASHPGQGNAGASVLRLASIGRELAYNDYQGSRGGPRRARGPQRPDRYRPPAARGRLGLAPACERRESASGPWSPWWRSQRNRRRPLTRRRSSSPRPTRAARAGSSPLAARAGTSMTYGGRVVNCSARFGVRTVEGRGFLYEEPPTDGLLVDVTQSGGGTVPYERTATYTEGEADLRYRSVWQATVVINSRRSARRPKRPEHWIDPGRLCNVYTTLHAGDTIGCKLKLDF